MCACLVYVCMRASASANMRTNKDPRVSVRGHFFDLFILSFLHVIELLIRPRDCVSARDMTHMYTLSTYKQIHNIVRSC